MPYPDDLHAGIREDRPGSARASIRRYVRRFLIWLYLAVTLCSSSNGEILARAAGCGYAAPSLFLRGLCCQPDPRLLRHRGSAVPALATTMMSQLAYPSTADGLAVAVVIGRCPCSCWWGERADPGRGPDCRAAAGGSAAAPGCRGRDRASRGSVTAVP